MSERTLLKKVNDLKAREAQKKAKTGHWNDG